MQQSLYAFMAIVLLSLFMLSQVRNSLHRQGKAYDRQLEVISADIANDYLERQIELLHYDEGLTGVGLDPALLVNPPTAMLSSNSNLGSESGEVAATYDDIDDWHLKSDSGSFNSNGNLFNYKVNFNVSYIDPANGNVTTTRTLAKKVQAEVILAEYKVPIRISRIYTPSQLFMKEAAIAEATSSPGPATASSPTTPPAPLPPPTDPTDDDDDSDDTTTTTPTPSDSDDDADSTPTPPPPPPPPPPPVDTDW